jgi:ankyrin repeat protein
MLFEAQDWITQGKPLDLPLTLSPKERKKSPLQIAIELGFHSLIQILVENGASFREPRYSALNHTLEKRRLDIVQLLVRNGAQIDSVDMKTVFDTWDKEIMIFFIENGADCETNQPLAYAFRSKIRTALPIYMQYKDRFPHFQNQIDRALRYHCKEGNLKWVSLLIWAWADPYTKGPEAPEGSPEDYISALELAALYGHNEIFKLKSIHLDPEHARAHDLLANACYSENADLLLELLKNGFDPK